MYRRFQNERTVRAEFAVYSNELGKNALKVLGLVENSTACEDVLVFERKLMDK